METTTTTVQTPPVPPVKPFSGLFEPLKPSDGPAQPAQGNGSNAATGAVPNSGAPAPGSEASKSGTVTADQAFSGLGNTATSSFSTSAAPGGPTGPGAAPQASVSLGGMVQGEWAVNIMDALLPAAMVAGLYALGVKVRKSEIQMTAAEKATVAPIMQKCLDSILLNFDSPWTALTVTLVAIYGGKLMEKGLVAFIDNKQEAKQTEVLRERLAQADQVANPAQYDYANQSAADIQDGKVIIPNQGLPFDEATVKAYMKSRKCGRDKAIAALKKKFNLQ